MNIQILIFLVGIFPSGHFSMQPDEVNKLKEIIKNLNSVKLNFDEIRKEMDRFYECQCVNGRKRSAIPDISKVIEFQIGSARHEYQQSLNDGVLSTNNDRKNAKQRIRDKFDRTMDDTKVSDVEVTVSFSKIKINFRIEFGNTEPRQNINQEDSICINNI